MNSLRGKRVLITGAAGFIGANLVRQLLAKQAEVHALVRPDSNLWRLTAIAPQLSLHSVDLNDAEHLTQTLTHIQPEIIFHAAATGGHQSQPEDREAALMTNVLGTARLLEALRPINFTRLVHLGSSLEYGAKAAPMNEADCLTPITFRGVTKAAATLLCQQFALAEQRPVVVIRPLSVFGYWEQPTRIIPTVIRATLKQQPIALTAPGYRRDFVFVEDVVSACLMAATAEHVAGEIINAGSGQQWSNEEVVEMVGDICGVCPEVKTGAFPQRPPDTDYWVADIQKAEKLLGWQPRHSLRDGLTKTVAWFRAHQHLYEPRGTASL